MRIRYLSDLHLWPDFEATMRPPRPALGDVFVVAGDLAADPALAVDWLIRVRAPVVYVLGNHEFYGRDFDGAITEYRVALAGLPHVRLLEREEVEIDGVRFLGATLWTDFHGDPVAALRAETGLNDFQYIRFRDQALRAPVVSERHHETRAWLSQALSVGDPERTVVVTHHAPSFQSAHPRWQGDPLTPAFCADLDSLIAERQPAIWLHGHLHESAEYAIGTTLVRCNPFGYGWPGANQLNPEFDPGAGVEVVARNERASSEETHLPVALGFRDHPE